MFVEVPYFEDGWSRKYKTVNTDLIKFIEDDPEIPDSSYYYPRKCILVFTDGTRFLADDSRYDMGMRLNGGYERVK